MELALLIIGILALCGLVGKTFLAIFSIISGTILTLIALIRFYERQEKKL